MIDKITYANGSTSSVEEGLKWAKGGVPKGWHDIIDRLWVDILGLGWDGTLFQTKEKWGGLRFYIGGAADAVHNRIHQAEAESEETCQDCGKPGKMRTSGWVVCLCDEHYEQDPNPYKSDEVVKV